MHADPANSEQRFRQMADQLLDGGPPHHRPDAARPRRNVRPGRPDTVNEFLTAVPHAEAVDVSNTGHMVAGDDNDAFTTAVLTFLDRIPPIPQPRQAPDQ